ncbi:hypothetical protein [Microcoleus sp. D2_18a_D3]|uniref:hypothetical protein n=1 Tax=Microcoleus sp. D2_18a_D3 TaxID=3055330 RepID=UPI002FD4F31D
MAELINLNATTTTKITQGVFTPIVGGMTTMGVATYNSQVGTFTQIGNRILFDIYLRWSAHTGTGNMRVFGLPYSANSPSSIAIWHKNLNLLANYICEAYVSVSNANTITLHQVPAGGGPPSSLNLDSSAELMLSGHYTTGSNQGAHEDS